MKQNIRVLTWFNFFVDFKLYAPIAIIYFSQVSGSYALGMSVFSIAMISSALFEVPTGVFSDMIGRRKTVILGAASAIMFAIFYAIGHSFWVLAAGALFEGLSMAFYSGNNDALLHDTLAERNEEHRYAEELGKISKMFQIALAVSAILGGLVIAFWAFSLVMWLSVIPQVLCLILAFKLIEPRIHSARSGNIYQHLKEATLGFLHNKKLRLLSLSTIIGYGFGEASYQFQSAFFATVWPVWAIPIVKTISNIGASLSFHFSGAVIKRFNFFKVIILGNVYTRTINTIALIFPTIFSPLIMSTSSLFYGVLSVGKNTLMQKEFRDEQRATMSSLNSFAGNIFFGIASLLIGLTADRFSPATALLILQVFQVANIFIYIRLFRSHYNSNQH